MWSGLCRKIWNVIPVDLVIDCLERMGLLHDLVGRITELDANIREVKSKMDKEGRCTINLQLGVKSNDQVRRIGFH